MSQSDPIGTAQERELIEDAATRAAYLVAYADTVAKAMYGGERPAGIWNLERAAKLLRDQSDALQSRIAEVAELREALRPFAESAELADGMEADDADYLDRALFTAGDYRRARAALSLHRRPTNIGGS